MASALITKLIYLFFFTLIFFAGEERWGVVFSGGVGVIWRRVYLLDQMNPLIQSLSLRQHAAKASVTNLAGTNSIHSANVAKPWYDKNSSSHIICLLLDAGLQYQPFDSDEYKSSLDIFQGGLNHIKLPFSNVIAYISPAWKRHAPV